MPAFKVNDEGGGFFTIKDVPVFEMHSDRGFPCDVTWMQNAIANHASYKGKQWRPPIIIGHNIRGQEKEAVGFLDNLVLKGKRLYADLVRVPGEIKAKIIKNSYPSRSVEVLPKSKRILALALLGGTAPHFALPQMTYENDENSLWCRSPEMLTMTEAEKAELYAVVGEAVGEAMPGVLERFLSPGDGDGTGDEETMLFVDQESGEEYTLPVSVLRKLGVTVAKGAAKVGAAATKAGGARTAGGQFVKQTAGRRALSKAGAAATRAGAAMAGHPGVTGAGTVAVGAGAVAAGARRRKKDYERVEGYEGFAIDEETCEVFLDGEAVGMLVTYGEMHEVGMDVPRAVKKPHALPKVGGATVKPAVSAAAVGTGTPEATGLEGDPGAPLTSLVEPVAREVSDQFDEDVAAELYDLRQEVGTLQNANDLLSQGRRAETFESWLTEQQAQGTPVGDIDKTVEFLMTQDDKQAEAYKALLIAQPKVALGRLEEAPRTFEAKSAEDVRADYDAHLDEYRALGVKPEDLKWAQYVRTEKLTPQAQPIE